MAPAFQSTPTRTPAAASLVSLEYFATSRTRTQLTPAVCHTVNMANVECQAWGRHTASVTADIQGTRATEVRKTWLDGIHIYDGCVCVLLVPVPDYSHSSKGK